MSAGDRISVVLVVVFAAVAVAAPFVVAAVRGAATRRIAALLASGYWREAAQAARRLVPPVEARRVGFAMQQTRLTALACAGATRELERLGHELGGPTVERCQLQIAAAVGLVARGAAPERVEALLSSAGQRAIAVPPALGARVEALIEGARALARGEAADVDAASLRGLAFDDRLGALVVARAAARSGVEAPVAAEVAGSYRDPVTPEEERELAEDAARARRPARAALGRLRLATLAAVAPTTLVAAMVAITVVGVDLSLNDALMAPLGLFSCVAGAAVAVARAGRPVSATIEATGLLGGGVAVFAGELAGVALIFFGLMAASRGAVVAAELRARAAATMARRAFWWNAGATVAAILITPRATAGLALLVRAVSVTGLLAVGVTLVIAWRTLGAVSRRQAADDMALNELG